MGLEERFPEAERLLKEVVNDHRADGLTAIDLHAGKQLNGGLVDKELRRTERVCHRLLINLYLREGKKQEAREALADFQTLHKGHWSCDYAAKRVEKILTDPAGNAGQEVQRVAV